MRARIVKPVNYRPRGCVKVKRSTVWFFKVPVEGWGHECGEYNVTFWGPSTPMRCPDCGVQRPID